MKKCIVHLESNAPYTQSRMHHEAKLNKESGADYEERTWRNKAHVTPDGFVFIPSISFKMALDRAGAMLSMKIEGRGKATYTKHFLAGVIIPDDLRLPLKIDDVTKLSINANADGKRGSGTRVVRHFPQIPKWFGFLECYVVDDTITPPVFEKHMKEAGLVVGIGQYRPERGGNNGRFRCVEFAWSDAA